MKLHDKCPDCGFETATSKVYMRVRGKKMPRPIGTIEYCKHCDCDWESNIEYSGEKELLCQNEKG